mgnify:CR=1 FL=1
MRRDHISLISLVYIITNNNIKGSEIIAKLKEYGGNNVNNLTGTADNSCYFISPENVISYGNTRDVLSVLKLAGYKDITDELEITEYTIEEIAKLLGKDPNSIRIKK